MKILQSDLAVNDLIIIIAMMAFIIVIARIVKLKASGSGKHLTMEHLELLLREKNKSQDRLEEELKERAKEINMLKEQNQLLTQQIYSLNEHLAQNTMHLEQMKYAFITNIGKEKAEHILRDFALFTKSNSINNSANETPLEALKDGRIIQAIDLALKDITYKEDVSDLIQARARTKRLESEIMLGNIDNEEANREKNRITSSILHIIQRSIG